ncbi:MAG: hypothetical protein AAB344_04630, partial [Bacteroidota bacterium]
REVCSIVEQIVEAVLPKVRFEALNVIVAELVKADHDDELWLSREGVQSAKCKGGEESDVFFQHYEICELNVSTTVRI